MQRLRNRKRKVYDIDKDNEPINYLFNVNMYDKPPNCNKPLCDLEVICTNRLKLYKILTEANNSHEIYSKEWCEVVTKCLKEKKLTDFLALLNIFENNNISPIEPSVKSCLARTAREDDHIGHYILSLVFCHNAQSILFFLDYEQQWFSFRFKILSDIDRHGFLIDNGLNQKVITGTEKNQIKNQLIQCFAIRKESFSESVFCKLRFHEVYDLVETRKVFLHKGYAYFLEQDVISAVICQLKNIWLERLHLFNEHVDELTDTRIKILVKNFLPECLQQCQNIYNDDSYSTLNIETIDYHAKKYFPLCMQHMHDLLKKNSHLRFYCRKQYATFLKHAGMPYEDAMNFFKTEFTKIISVQEYVKNKYDYYFRHVYGQVGGRINYRCDSCNNLFKEGPALNEDNGCPFAAFDNAALYKKLQENALKMADIEDILFSKVHGRYKEACSKYFAATQKDGNQISFLESPNQYYHLAVRTHNERVLILNNCYVNDYFEE